ncbi:hypothetical protein ACX80C_14195 [Arthrobacter tecti]
MLTDPEVDASALGCALATADSGLNPIHIGSKHLHRAVLSQLTPQSDVRWGCKVFDGFGTGQFNE